MPDADPTYRLPYLALPAKCNAPATDNLTQLNVQPDKLDLQTVLRPWCRIPKRWLEKDTGQRGIASGLVKVQQVKPGGGRFSVKTEMIG